MSFVHKVVLWMMQRRGYLVSKCYLNESRHITCPREGKSPSVIRADKGWAVKREHPSKKV